MEALLMTLGSGWVSGIRPYFMVFLLGITGRVFGLEQIPDVLQRTDVLVITGILLVVDLAADKVPYFDSFWDQLHTVVRPIAGAAIGYLLGGETSTVDAVVMAVLGGVTALGAHTTKATVRAAVNVSPEPVSTALVSTGEDVAAVVIGVLVIALPVVAAVMVVALLVAGLWAVRRIHRAFRNLRGRLRAARSQSRFVPGGAGAEGGARAADTAEVSPPREPR